MKTLIKLLLVTSVLLPLNTTHAFWGDIGDKYITIEVTSYSVSAQVQSLQSAGGGTPESRNIIKSLRDVQLKDLWFKYSERKAGWYAYTKSNKSRALGMVVERDDIKLVEKYVKKYQ